MSRSIASLCCWAALSACIGEQSMTGETPVSTGLVCQAGTECCKPEELVCQGNPDGTLVCACHKSWACDDALSPKKCSQQPAATPDGKGGWSCTVSLGVERCTSSGSTLPPGKNGWSCVKTGAGVDCTRPTQTPDGGGGWSCNYQGAVKVCEKSTPTPTPTTDAGAPVNPQPDGSAPTGWSCSKDAAGATVCQKPASGTPPGGSWKCTWKSGSITCEGSSSSPPGGGGWTCTAAPQVGGFRCLKTFTAADQPPGGGSWDCLSDSQKGTTCLQQPTPAPGKECVVGQKMWCDGAIYCGYGQVACGPDGKWKTKGWSKELDCVELSSGARPNTVCACYFFFFNPDCCETPDCLVPSGSTGQICPASKGNFCDYCNPEKPECVGTGAQCVVTAKNETFCGQACAGGKACPAGSVCAQIQGAWSGQWVWQCIPADQSCYY